jgi:hypothetical protein
MSDPVVATTDPSPALKVIEGIELDGTMNTDDTTVCRHIAHSIRLQLPQFWPQEIKGDRIALVGGGPSLRDTANELVQLYHEGALIVTMNGAYHWCLERNIRPSAQIVLDARADNARFVTPATPRCRYLLASQCHPDTWAAVLASGAPEVYIWHSVAESGPRKDLLDAYYLKRWTPVPGGATVATRAISLLRQMGYLRFDLFGVDSCWMGDQHHAFAQPENDKDRRLIFRVSPPSRPDLGRDFVCAPWHLKQLEDFLQFIRVSGHNFVLNVHGDGLIAYALQTAATLADVVQAEEGVRDGSATVEGL